MDTYDGLNGLRHGFCSRAVSPATSKSNHPRQSLLDTNSITEDDSRSVPQTETGSISSPSWSYSLKFPPIPRFSTDLAPCAVYMWPDFRASFEMRDNPQRSPQQERIDSASLPGTRATIPRLRALTRRIEALSISPLTRLLNPLDSDSLLDTVSPSSPSAYDSDLPPRQGTYTHSPIMPSSPSQSPPAVFLATPPASSSQHSELPRSKTTGDISEPHSAATQLSSPMPTVVCAPSARPSNSSSNLNGKESREEFIKKLDALMDKDLYNSKIFRCAQMSVKDCSKQCGYWGSIQLVRRHIASVHLGVKDFECEFCGKRFFQKTAMQTHHNKHTGEKPHKCRDQGCSLEFKDPARLHKHRVKDHKLSNISGPLLDAH
ncbi:C2H2-type domain-containing protein [Mycena indigotica]|uniref:C2H2-type domain-containing protein n=1 Tax=Mycena indigotica TaxID=2126181 RepID=A0A8H6W142_9AGAR|nr:C2H2-type domain-containing protein [Mycena indigotica]KAF7301664.1 C2H2-type domain-containing protein [Mycena indigotica]